MFKGGCGAERVGVARDTGERLGDLARGRARFVAAGEMSVLQAESTLTWGRASGRGRNP